MSVLFSLRAAGAGGGLRGRSLICSVAILLTAAMGSAVPGAWAVQADQLQDQSPMGAAAGGALAQFRVALLRYSFTQKGPSAEDQSLDIILLLPNREPQAWRVPVPSARFAEDLRAAYRSIASLQAPDPAPAGQPDRLYTLLLAPVRAILDQESITTLLISADRGFQAVPFAALHDGRRYMGERFSFALTPSLALTPLAVPAAITRPSATIAFGATEFQDSTDLPLAREEVARVGEDAAAVFLDQQFTPEALISGVARADVGRVHVASHAEFGPTGSHVFTGRGKLAFQELNRASRSVDADALSLFYLSACRTAVGDPAAELGFSGLALQIGSDSAVGSLWNVNDLASAAFAVMFYRYLDQGLVKSEAALAARLVMIRGQLRVQGGDLYGPFPEPLVRGLTTEQARSIRLFHLPYFWAGMTVVGSPW